MCYDDSDKKHLSFSVFECSVESEAAAKELLGIVLIILV
jgi:hypothetical protein